VADDRPDVVLTPQERALPSWLPLGPPQPRTDAPVDLALAELVLRTVKTSHGWWSWRTRPFGDDVSPVAAAFWLRVAFFGERRRRPLDAFEKERRHGTREPPSTDEVLGFVNRTQLPPACQLPAVLALVPPQELAERLVGGLGRQDGHSTLWNWAARARPLLLPLLSVADRASLREQVARFVRPRLGSPRDLYGLELTLAAALGLHEEVESVLATWRDNWLGEAFNDGDVFHFTLLLGLPDADRFVREAIRLGLDMSDEEGAATWLSVTGTTRLDRFERTLMRAPNRDLAVLTARAWLRRVHHPAMAPHALAGLRSRAPAVARGWLDAHPREAVAGLAPLLARHGAPADAAREELARLLRSPDTGAAARAAVDRLEDGDARRVRQLVDAAERSDETLADATPAWLDAPELTRSRLPGWVDVDGLPPLVVHGRWLREEDVERVLQALRASGEEPHLAVRTLWTAADGTTAEDFAWSLMQAWLGAGAPPRDAWALMAVGYLGGDRSAQRLARLVRAWPGEGQHRRARLGLRALRAIGTDVALALLNDIARRLRFKALREEARTAMEQIARERGIPRDELEDRIVPDAGLAPDGSRVFDYGPRRFTLVIGSDLRPLLRDADGRLRRSLPTPGARDDAELASAAREQWKAVRRTVVDTLRQQTLRLEDAMVTQRSWSAAAFELHLAGHPVMRHLVRLLVFEATAPDGPRRSFRLTAGGEPVDVHGAALALAANERVTLVHPLQLTPEERDAWTAALADAEIVQPFPQLQRPLHDVTADELDARDITRFNAAAINPRTLVGMLEHRGWQREGVADAGIFTCHAKEFPAAGVTVAVQYAGIPIGALEDLGPQRIEHCYAVPGRPRDRNWEHGAARADALLWAHVDPIIRSEVLTVLHEVAAKGSA
jgi:Domain of unknown function (DUF4132)